MKGFVLNDRKTLMLQQPLKGLENLRLLCKHAKLEIMTQHLVKGAVVWMEPAQQHDDLEFFYLLTGSLTFRMPGRTQNATAGDSFYVCGLEDMFAIDVVEETELLYVSTAPVFGENMDFQMELMRRLNLIDEKDTYTAQHSKNVMHYTMALRNELENQCTICYGDMAVAALFHDIGKCVIPDVVLKKPGRFTDEEYACIRLHAQASADILASHYNADICRIAGCHHERLDGSGYPNHLKGSEIPFDARVLAVADSFDAMTSHRSYNRIKSPEVAALELLHMPQQYDICVTEALMKLVQTHALPPILS